MADGESKSSLRGMKAWRLFEVYPWLHSPEKFLLLLFLLTATDGTLLSASSQVFTGDKFTFLFCFDFTKFLMEKVI